jgi:hypothetical protein
MVEWTVVTVIDMHTGHSDVPIATTISQLPPDSIKVMKLALLQGTHTASSIAQLVSKHAGVPVTTDRVIAEKRALQALNCFAAVQLADVEGDSTPFSVHKKATSGPKRSDKASEVVALLRKKCVVVVEIREAPWADRATRNPDFTHVSSMALIPIPKTDKVLVRPYGPHTKYGPSELPPLQCSALDILRYASAALPPLMDGEFDGSAYLNGKGIYSRELLGQYPSLATETLEYSPESAWYIPFAKLLRNSC